MSSFVANPAPLYDLLHELRRRECVPTTCHKLLAQLERRGSLLHAYSANVDGLESAAGVRRVSYLHGSVRLAHCCVCRAPADPARLGAVADAAHDGARAAELRCSSCSHALSRVVSSRRLSFSRRAPYLSRQPRAQPHRPRPRVHGRPGSVPRLGGWPTLATAARRRLPRARPAAAGGDARSVDPRELVAPRASPAARCESGRRPRIRRAVGRFGRRGGRLAVGADRRGGGG
mmetsp:Transcript_7639/g.25159  ORF Transcript_7639/g.25159 Transcript_7639/m.25159 type:complete len:232 (-) Transcript_7639:341-1036(-)